MWAAWWEEGLGSRWDRPPNICWDGAHNHLVERLPGREQVPRRMGSHLIYEPLESRAVQRGHRDGQSCAATLGTQEQSR